MNRFLLALVFSSTLFAADGDLTLPGERWLAQFNGYICAAFTSFVEKPASHSEIQVQFESIKSDHSLDNILLKGSFTEGNTECSYTAILLADNAASTAKLVESRAVALDAGGSCEEGKRLLDSQLESNDYLYYGHPHNAAIMLPDATAKEVCGESATHIGINFVVKGLIKK